MSNEQKRWKVWADNLRQAMMANRTPEVTKSVEEISQETGTGKSAATLHSQRFWNACRDGEGSHSMLSKAGLDVRYAPNAAGKVDAVTFCLGKNWRPILQGILDRQV